MLEADPPFVPLKTRVFQCLRNYAISSIDSVGMEKHLNGTKGKSQLAMWGSQEKANYQIGLIFTEQKPNLFMDVPVMDKRSNLS
jgi:hypothetical protein